MPVFIRTSTQNATVSLLLYPLVTAVIVRPDSRGWKNKAHLLMGQWHVHTGGKESMMTVLEISHHSTTVQMKE